jgi:hypothetical protein
VLLVGVLQPNAVDCRSAHDQAAQTTTPAKTGATMSLDRHDRQNAGQPVEVRDRPKDLINRQNSRYFDDRPYQQLNEAELRQRTAAIHDHDQL